MKHPQSDRLKLDSDHLPPRNHFTDLLIFHIEVILKKENDIEDADKIRQAIRNYEDDTRLGYYKEDK